MTLIGLDFPTEGGVPTTGVHRQSRCGLRVEFTSIAGYPLEGREMKEFVGISLCHASLSRRLTLTRCRFPKLTLIRLH